MSVGEMPREEILIIEYYDPATVSGWEDRLDVEREKPYLCEVVGWLVCEDRDFVRLSAMRCDQLNNFNNRVIVPKGCIAKRTVVKGE